MSYPNQEPTFYDDPNMYYYSSHTGPSYSPARTSGQASMTREYSAQSNTSYSSGASASSPESFDPHSSPSQQFYNSMYPNTYTTSQQYPATALYTSEPQKRSRAECKPTKATNSYPCLYEGCTSRAQFTRAADLERHHRTVHFVKEKLDCPERWCGRVGEHGFTRKDHLVEHQRSFHMQDVPKTSKGSKKQRHS